MKTMFMIFAIAFQSISGYGQIKKSSWKVKKVATNYLKKGIEDNYELPLHLKGKMIQIGDSFFVQTDLIKSCPSSTLSEDFGDTVNIERKIYFRRQEGSQISLQYPGDEFVDCIEKNSDTCYVGESFSSLLGIRGNGICAYVSVSGKYSKAKCILFILDEGKNLVLYSGNDFLLFFLSRVGKSRTKTGSGKKVSYRDAVSDSFDNR